jgi:2-dehydropantoate 2-reductase
MQDLVVIAVKGPALADVARRIGPLLSPSTLVLPAMNGVPWWFGQACRARRRRRWPASTRAAHRRRDPVRAGDRLRGACERVVAGTRRSCCTRRARASSSASRAAARSERAQRGADLLAGAGLDVTHSADVR